MKARSLVLCVCFLLVVSGCSRPRGQDIAADPKNVEHGQMAETNPKNAELEDKGVVVAHVSVPNPVPNAGGPASKEFFIVQTSGTSVGTESATFSGAFDLVVRDRERKQLDRQSLNRFFGDEELIFHGPVNLVFYDYNGDGQWEVPIGFPTDDGGGEYKYVLFQVGPDGFISPLPVEGYKQNGFIHTAPGGNSIQFTTNGGTGEGQPSGMLVGVAKEGGGFRLARYLWDGEKFRFEKDTSPVIAKAELDANGKKYLETIVQTEYKKPLTSADAGFTIEESRYRGRFDLVVQDDNGKVTSRVSLNKYFGNDDLGFGTPQLSFKDYNRDGNLEFAVGRPYQVGFQYAMFSVSPDGTLSYLPAVGYLEDGFIYDAGRHGTFLMLDGEPGIKVTLWTGHGYGGGKYLWDGRQFVFSGIIK